MTKTRAAVALALVLAAPAGARADADEASLNVHLVGGAARLSDPVANGPSSSATAPLAGLGGRFSFSRSNLLQWEVRGLVATASATYPGVMTVVGGVPRTGDLSRRTTLAQLELGATWRFGVRFIPTIHLGVGAQSRFRSAGTLSTGALAVDDGAGIAVDLTGTAALGFDYRISRRLVAGIELGATYALPLRGPDYQAVEGFVQCAYYWYPRW